MAQDLWCAKWHMVSQLFHSVSLHSFEAEDFVSWTFSRLSFNMQAYLGVTDHPAPMQHSTVTAVSPFLSVGHVVLDHPYHLFHTTKITGCQQVLLPCVIWDTGVAGDFLTIQKIIESMTMRTKTRLWTKITGRNNNILTFTEIYLFFVLVERNCWTLVKLPWINIQTFLRESISFLC